MDKSAMYCIPERFRKTENLHIVFWLFKDISWAMLWKPLGILMIIPTVSLAVMISWQTRKIKSELFHNLAVVCWIIANATWMLLEFSGLDEQYKKYTAIPFVAGILFIAIYYLYYLPKEVKQKKLMALQIPAGETQVNIANPEV